MKKLINKYFTLIELPVVSRVKILVFTLIELLVVIAIIAILMTMLLPALKKVRERSKEILCVSNQKQAMLSLVNYSSDFNGFIPIWYNSDLNYCWSMILMKSGYIIYTPNNGGNNMPETFLTCPSIYPYGQWHSEGYSYGLRTSSTNINLMNMALSKYHGPIIADSLQYPDDDPIRTWYHFTTGASDQRMIDCRHNRKANAGFEDGSVRAISTDYFSEWAKRANAYFYYYVNGVVRNGYYD